MGQTASIENRFRALLITPAYSNTGHRLDCTIEDGKAWYDLLTTQAQVPTNCIRWISDSKRYPQVQRSSLAKDIADELNSLIEWSKTAQNPVIFLAYSGHGTQQRDQDGDEEDGLDEGWVTSDLGFVRDDYLNQSFLARLGANVRVIAVNDACYNGTVWDTPFTAMYIGKQVPQISNKKRSRMGFIAPVVDPEAVVQATQDAVKVLGYEAGAPIVTAASQQAASVSKLLIGIVAMVYAYYEYVKKRAMSNQVMAIVAFALMQLASYATSRTRTPKAMRSATMKPIVESIKKQEDLDKTVARYSSSVSQLLNGTSNGSKRVPVVCTFTGMSSSNDKQVSYEGAKNGFFTYQLHTILKKELVPILKEQPTLEEVLTRWNKSGYALVNEIGSSLHRMGINQNPIWQVITDVNITPTTSIFLQ